MTSKEPACLGQRRGECSATIVRTIAGVPLCARHERETLRRLAVARRSPSLDDDPPPVQSKRKLAVVYYIGDRNTQQIKIGTTVALGQRFRSLESNRVGPLLLLATEPGSYAVEGQRHVEFNYLRLRGEWFRRDARLMYLITDLRLAHGILPSQDGGPPERCIARLKGPASMASPDASDMSQPPGLPDMAERMSRSRTRSGVNAKPI